MELSPGLHPLHGARAPEVIAIAVFAEPSALAGVLTWRADMAALDNSADDRQSEGQEEKTYCNDGIFVALESGS